MWDRVLEVFSWYGVGIAAIYLLSFTKQSRENSDPSDLVFTPGLGWGAIVALGGIPYILLGEVVFH